MHGVLIVSVEADRSGDEAAATAALAKAPKAQTGAAVSFTGAFLVASGGGDLVPTRDGIFFDFVSIERERTIRCPGN